MDFQSPEFWIAVGQIIMIDILLGGDNAVVIALASRRLPDAQRKQAIFWGMFGAVALRVILIFFALQLLKVPFLKIVGGVLLLYIGIKLLMPHDEDGGHDIDASTHLFGAIKTIVLADAVMSLDNVIGIASIDTDETRRSRRSRFILIVNSWSQRVCGKDAVVRQQDPTDRRRVLYAVSRRATAHWRQLNRGESPRD